MAAFNQRALRSAASAAPASALPVLSVSDATVVEGDTGGTFAVFTVTLSAVTNTPVTFSFSTGNGTAVAASDYGATKGTLTIPAGQPSAQIKVQIFGDKLVESDENFALHLFTATGATFAGGASSTVATGTILNDDRAILKMDSPTIVEGSSGQKYAVFTVSLSNRSDSPITFNYATADATATAGSDYVATSGTFTIPALQPTATISVAINGDTTFEPDETFKLNLSSLSGATFDGGAATYGRNATIVNDDPSVTVSMNNPTIVEGDSGTTNEVFTVTLSAAATSDVTLSYATTDGTATAGSDYVSTTGTLTIAAGQTTGTINVAVIGDTVAESKESFTLRLSTLSGASFAGGSSSYAKPGTIVDNDSASPAASASAATMSNALSSMAFASSAATSDKSLIRLTNGSGLAHSSAGALAA